MPNSAAESAFLLGQKGSGGFAPAAAHEASEAKVPGELGESLAALAVRDAQSAGKAIIAAQEAKGVKKAVSLFVCRMADKRRQPLRSVRIHPSLMGKRQWGVSAWDRSAPAGKAAE